MAPQRRDQWTWVNECGKLAKTSPVMGSFFGSFFVVMCCWLIIRHAKRALLGVVQYTPHEQLPVNTVTIFCYTLPFWCHIVRSLDCIVIILLEADKSATPEQNSIRAKEPNAEGSGREEMC